MTISHLPDSSMTDTRDPTRTLGGGNAMDLFLGTLLLLLPMFAFFVGAPLAVLTGFIFAVVVAAVFPRTVPLVLIMVFLFQNTFISTLSPYVTSLSAFDTLRGMNFVVLCSCYGVFLATMFFNSHLFHPGLKRWLIACNVMLVFIVFYFALGVAVGDTRDALVYLRNILTPLACLHIGLMAGALYRPNISEGLTILVCLAMAFGFLEFFFGLDWLSIFNGDDYIRLKVQDNIDAGDYERRLELTGEVFGRLEDEIKRPFLNITGQAFGSWKITRIGGPNFHSISFAYGLALITTYLAANGRRWTMLAAIPLMVLIGSKGALMLFGFVLIALAAVRVFAPRFVLSWFLFGVSAYVAATYALGVRSADYHVLGLRAGFRDFFANPFGYGIGKGGISSTSNGFLDWARFQSQGIADFPVESSIGVLLYQTGPGALLFLGIIVAISCLGWRTFMRTRELDVIVTLVVPVMLLANGLFQEEAFFAPLALGTGLLLTGLMLSSRNYGLQAPDEEMRQS